jgi:hypothetical protein
VGIREARRIGYDSTDFFLFTNKKTMLRSHPKIYVFRVELTKEKSLQTTWLQAFGGDEEIRTLEERLTPTRFPVL